MDFITSLAQAIAAFDIGAAAESDSTALIDLLWQQITNLGVLEALTFISFGTVCLFYGWRVFKVLVVISFALLGLVLGMVITEKIVGINNQLAGGLVGMVVLAMLSVPLMRWSVCVLGAAAGAVVVSGIWYAVGLSESYIWAGAVIGIIAGGMISFIIFRVAVILFSSLGGSALVVTGTLALLWLYPKTKFEVQTLVFSRKWFLPIAIIIPTAIGLILQNRFVKGSKDWNI